MKKGPKFEADVVDWMRANGWPYAERRVMGGIRDRGDIAGIPELVAELKNTNRHDLAGALDEAKAEAANAGVEIYVTIMKRRGKGDPGDAYAVTDLRTFNRLFAAWDGA